MRTQCVRTCVRTCVYVVHSNVYAYVCAGARPYATAGCACVRVCVCACVIACMCVRVWRVYALVGARTCDGVRVPICIYVCK